MENVNTEYKREYTDGVRRAVVAFANTDGGTLYLGIDDNGELCGLTPLAQKGRLVRRDVQAALGDSQVTAALLLRCMAQKGSNSQDGRGAFQRIRQGSDMIRTEQNATLAGACEIPAIYTPGSDGRRPWPTGLMGDKNEYKDTLALRVAG